MHLELEDGRIVNVELITVLEMDHRRKNATVWDAGVRTISDSHILYRYFAAQQKITLPPEEDSVQAG
jgi:hypothetical protein